MTSEIALIQPEKLPDWLFEKNNGINERDYAYKVVNADFKSVFAPGKYCQEYFEGNTVEALPDTIGLRLFLAKDSAQARAESITNGHVLRVAPCKNDAFYLPRLKCLSPNSETELDDFYNILRQQQNNDIDYLYSALYKYGPLPGYTIGDEIYCQKIIVSTEV